MGKYSLNWIITHTRERVLTTQPTHPTTITTGASGDAKHKDIRIFEEKIGFSEK